MGDILDTERKMSMDKYKPGDRIDCSSWEEACKKADELQAAGYAVTVCGTTSSKDGDEAWIEIGYEDQYVPFIDYSMTNGTVDMRYIGEAYLNAKNSYFQ